MGIDEIFLNIGSQIKDNLFHDLGKHIKNITKIIDDKIETAKNIQFHVDGVIKWANSINFKDLTTSKKLNSVYIQLDTYLYPLSFRMSKNEKIAKKKLLNVIDESDTNILILGQPGSGKTTSMKYVISKKLEEMQTNKKFPILIVTRELKFENKKIDNNVLLSELASIFGINVLDSLFSLIIREDTFMGKEEVSKKKLELWHEDNKRRLFNFIDSHCSIIIIEGIDEIPSEDAKKKIFEDIYSLSKYLVKTKIIITTRTGDYLGNIENFNINEIAPLDESQIEEFIRKWIKNKDKALTLKHEISKSPYADTIIKPLTLAHLCAIYERSGKIPDKPKTLYKKIVNLLLEEWDQQREINRTSNYSKFEVDRKFEFLSCLAFQLTVNYRKNIFSTRDIEEIYKSIHEDFDLPKNQLKMVAKEIESHSGLFVQAGYECYEFAHKSLQEYLTAEYISRLPSINLKMDDLKKMPNELAIAITLSSDPSLYFSELVFRHLISKIKKETFYHVFLNRLIQEKIDFNKSDKVVIAFLSLYSTLFKIINDNINGQLNLFPMDINFINFEKIYFNLSERKIFNNVLNIYEIKEINHFFDDEIVLLNRKTDLNKEFPKKIYSRMSFLKVNNDPDGASAPSL